MQVFGCILYKLPISMMEQLAPVSISALIEILLNFTLKTAEKLPDLGASCAVEKWPSHWYFGQD